MNLEKIYEIMEHVTLLKGIDIRVISQLLGDTFHITDFDKNTIVALEGKQCEYVGLVLDGTVELRKEFPGGHFMTLTYLERSDVFGEVIVFSPLSRYPATIITVTSCKIMFIHRNKMLMMIENNEQLLRNFMAILSSKIIMLNQKTSILSLKTIEEKVAGYLMEEYKANQSLIFNISMNRKALAGYLNIPRPSLSRTMSLMKKKGIIDYYQNTIKILSLEALEGCLF